tara:strand:+ start:1055 stop:1216 length:162 start_codon:yes stop_codon:yes gene_type:complete
MALDLLVTILSFVLPVCALILIFSMGKAMFNLEEWFSAKLKSWTGHKQEEPKD